MTLPELETPAVIVDLDKLEANIARAQSLANQGNVKLRPHSKSHECADIVKMQIKAGAVGVSSAKVEEATRMAQHGIDDIQIVHPMFGDHKLEKLKKLITKPGINVTCTVDMLEHAKALAQVGQAIGKDIPALLKVDTGVRRFGVLPGKPALRRAKEIAQVRGVKLLGIMGHESTHAQRTPEAVDQMCRQVASDMSDTAVLLKAGGIPIEHVVIGSTTALRFAPMLADFPHITEIHPGMYVFGDIMYVSNFAMTLDDCALSVLATVIGTNETSPSRAIIDAGGKTLTTDPLIHLHGAPGRSWQDKPSFGYIKGRPDLWFGRLPAENGILYFTDENKRVQLGQRLEIIPNNATMVVAMHEQIHGIRNGKLEQTLQITGRGLGN